jgi:vitamin B12 transporter
VNTANPGYCWLLLAVAALLLLPEASPAQSATMETMLVHGSRLPLRSSHDQSDAVIIDEEGIEQLNAMDTVDLLRAMAGVHISRQGGPGGVASLYVRGGEANFTSVYVNGIQVNNPADTRGGGYDFSILDPFLVSRIELVKGPRSAIYGSDALAGAINLRTSRRVTDLQSTGIAAGGERGQRALGLRIDSPLRTDGNLSAGYIERDYGELTKGHTLTSDVFTGSVSDSWERNSWSVDIVNAQFSRTAFPEDSGGPMLAILNELEHGMGDELVVAGRVEHQATDLWSADLLVGLYSRTDDVVSPGIAATAVPPNGQSVDFTRHAATLNNTVLIHANSELVAGLDFSREEGISSGYLDYPRNRIDTGFNQRRTIRSGFLEVRERPGAWTLSGAARYDSPSEFDAETTLRFGISYDLQHLPTQLSANWGQGYKLPSMFALGDNLVGNQDLKPESSEGFSASILQPFDTGYLKVTAFKNWYRDLIDFDFESFQNVNRDRVKTAGVEFELDWRPYEILNVLGYGAYTDTNVTGSSDELRGRPNSSAVVTVIAQPRDDLSAVLSYRWTGSVWQSSFVTGFAQLPAYTTLNMNLNWGLSPRLELHLAVDNVLDEQYAEAIGVPAPGRQLRAQFLYAIRHGHVH